MCVRSTENLLSLEGKSSVRHKVPQSVSPPTGGKVTPSATVFILDFIQIKNKFVENQENVTNPSLPI